MLSRPTSRGYSVPVRPSILPRLNNKGILSMQCWSIGVVDRGALAAGRCIESRRTSSAVVVPERIVAVEHRALLKRLLEELCSLLRNLSRAASYILTMAEKMRPQKFDVQMLLEKGMIDCRFFTLLAVAGSMVGSILCFIEGCLLVLESYVGYFQMISPHSNPGHVVHLLIEALDIFLVGTAMLTFGTSLHVMFIGLRTSAAWRVWPPTWLGTRSVLQAKTRVGHAVMMILQVGVLKKFMSVSVVTALDLACFAGAVLLSSACIFILSKLSFGSPTSTKKKRVA